jgi:hypothetical protein
MAKQHQYQFCFGPWNISEGQDPYGPTTRPPQTFDWKLRQLKKLGFDAMMFHDDDAVPDIDGKSAAQLRKESKELKKKLDDAGVAAEMVAPRLWFSPKTIDGAYTSNDPKCRQYAIDRSLRCIDIAGYLDTDLVVLWLAREGTYLREAKNGRRSVELLVQALDKMLAYDKGIRISIEPKPNEPMDHAYIPTIGHALAIAQLRQPTRFGSAASSNPRTRFWPALTPPTRLISRWPLASSGRCTSTTKTGSSSTRTNLSAARICALLSTRSARWSTMATARTANTSASTCIRSGRQRSSTGWRI